MNTINRLLASKGFDFSECVRKHSETPNVTYLEYMSARKEACSQRVSLLKKIYLDTKYWIRLRDVRLGIEKNPLDKEIYRVLTDAVRDDKAICPIGATLFLELSLQRDMTTKRTTAALMDDLSRGIALEFEFEMITLQIMDFILKNVHPNLHTELEKTCWINAGGIFGQVA